MTSTVPSAAENDAIVARALAAPTRAAILELLREGGSLTAREVADRAGVHPNVARTHLELLVSAGLVRAGWRRSETAGRPAKQYEALPGHVEHGTTLVAELLASLIELAAPDPMVARRVAEQTGERLGRRARDAGDSLAGFDEQIAALLDALSLVSGGVRISDRGDGWVEVEDFDCPFTSIAADHPQLACQLDKALKEGIMRALGADAYVEQVTSVAWGDASCREVVRLRAAPHGR